jgi:hypothetical protein
MRWKLLASIRRLLWCRGRIALNGPDEVALGADVRFAFDEVGRVFAA